jgi:hypothetical protein
MFSVDPDDIAGEPVELGRQAAAIERFKQGGTCVSVMFHDSPSYAFHR